MTTVVALGGNALIRAGDQGTAAQQASRLREAAASLAPLLREGPVVITHGNGPQVGNELIRQERAAEEVPPLPLYLAVAQTQAEIGSMIVTEVGPATGRPLACVVTHVVVAEDDPAFRRPTKPVGPFYSEDEARRYEQERGWTIVEEGGRGWRRTVPSPVPLDVVEVDEVQCLLDAGVVPVACGGGGIPVVRDGERLRGVEAVIDKDRASAVLAAALGAERLVILTDVPAVKRAFGTPDEEEISVLNPCEARELLPGLAEGSMRPKVEAAIAMAESGGEALITSLDTVENALIGQAGTRVSTRSAVGSDPATGP